MACAAAEGLAVLPHEDYQRNEGNKYAGETLHPLYDHTDCRRRAACWRGGSACDADAGLGSDGLVVFIRPQCCIFHQRSFSTTLFSRFALQLLYSFKILEAYITSSLPIL